MTATSGNEGWDERDERDGRHAGDERGAGDVFAAIAHPVRRQILDRLAEGEESVGHLAEPFGMSRPAVSQHLRVLRDAGLVSEERHGRERQYRLQPEGLNEVRTWLGRYDRFWRTRLSALGTYLDKEAQAEDEMQRPE